METFNSFHGKEQSAMNQQSAVMMQERQDSFDNLFVPPDTLAEQMQDVQDLISRRAYETFERRGRTHGYDRGDWFHAESTVLQPMRHEASDGGDAFVVIVDVGDYLPQELKMSAEPRHLRIVGRSERQSMSAGAPGYAPSSPRAFALSYQLPAPINPEKAAAKIRGDLLEVRLPKAASAAECRAE
jgi:HSP20 family molecular chaperone IbpA